CHRQQRGKQQIQALLLVHRGLPRLFSTTLASPCIKLSLIVHTPKPLCQKTGQSGIRNGLFGPDFCGYADILL
ncbi:MAG: hypothetical protein ACYDC1_25800, partial [Limisphaerales bacterium]